ncbi:MAG: glycosyltransferase family 39 protein [Chloroflexi bacterium]|nr:glycosyltransferase family 39 protein [Chloroflexota bacterium]
MQTTFTKFLPWFFFAAAFQSLLATFTLLRIPSEGLSFARLTLLGVMAILFFAGIGLGLYSRRDQTRFEPLFTTPVILLAALLTLTFRLLLFLLRYLNPEQLLPYYERLSPLLWLLFFLSLEASFFFLFVKNGFHPKALRTRQPIYRAAIPPLFLLLSAFAFIAITKIGIMPDTSYWAEPGVAIQGWQFILALLIGFSTLLFAIRHSLFFNSSLVTRCLPFALYLIAALFWLSVPLETLANSFFAPISPPTNLPLPYSDAGFYDLNAQSLLIGTGYFGSIPSRPLYVTFLAFLHLLFNQNYPAIIAGQTLLLALFPVTLYFLAKKLHSPAAGVTVALFAIFREYTGLWIASNTRVVNSKMLTTDFITALGIALMCLITIWWLERRDLRSTMIAGGAFGVLLLFRTQSLLTLPVLFLLVLLTYQFKWAACFKTGVVFVTVSTLTVLPWLAHNYTVIGKFAFDDSIQMGNLYSQYSFTGLDLRSFDPEKDSVAKQVISFTLENPAYVANFISSHFFNSEIGGLLALPLIKPFNGFQEPVNLYWVEWDGSLEWHNLLLVLFYLFVLALGFGAAWKKMGWLGLVPLAFNLGYVLSNSMVRFSGWRFNLPADWVIYFYFTIGVIELFGGLPLLLNANAKKIFPADETPKPQTIRFNEFHYSHLVFLSSFIFLGLTPWLAKGLTGPRYAATQDELIARLESKGYSRVELKAFLAQPDASLLEGRLLYPRMYWRGEGLSSTNPWAAYAPQDFSRIGFLLINDTNRNLIFRTNELLDFKQGADAIVLACSANDLLDVRIIAFDDAAYQSDELTEPCPEN